MKIKTLEHCPGSSLCAPKSQKVGSALKFLLHCFQVLRNDSTQPGGMPTGSDVVIPEKTSFECFEIVLNIRYAIKRPLIVGQ